MSDTKRCVHVIVSGRVQGVYFRAWTNQQAMSLGLDGWVRNRCDGSVEAVIDGPAAGVARMLDLLADGPPDARVETVEILSEGGSAPCGFSVRPTL
ncbi:MAG: acylphosphatase [Rhodobiaceae bacterium]|nr:acylphosphatase [Rhodobiaceae bacterium]MCC0041764.1 acylphosphatase [Rhodobiaceae bacterium]